MKDSPANNEPAQASEQAIKVPKIELPKGGGALKSIDEQFSVNAANGTSAFSIPLPFTPSRNGFTPSVALSYNSGTGNSIAGIGWDISLPAIQRKTDKLLPVYDDAEDTFQFSGMEELVPALDWDNGDWIPAATTQGGYSIQTYRPRAEGAFSIIEKITHATHGTYWRVLAASNTTTFYGFSAAARISDPMDATHIFQWLPEVSIDDKGNCIVYSYKKENLDQVSRLISEEHRFTGKSPFTNTYLKRIQYGNRVSCYVSTTNVYEPPAINTAFLLEAVFDFGEHNTAFPVPDEQPGLTWPARIDAFSTYRSGFEIRTYRLLKRILMYHRFDELNQGQPTLVKSLTLIHSASTATWPDAFECTYLTAIEQAGYILQGPGNYSRKTLPQLEFTYETLQWGNRVQEVVAANLPEGLSGNYQWLDLYGEGISGVFTEQGGSWLYRHNLGDMEEEGVAHLDYFHTVLPKPSFSGMNSGVLQLQDIEADGRKQVVIHAPGIDGYFELTHQNDWKPFQAFVNRVNIDMGNPYLRMLDLNGDGMADVMMTEDNVFTVYMSKGKEGYEAPHNTMVPLTEEKGPAIVFAEALQTIFLADMSGDGLTDLVRIRNGEVCYWPNMGYGRFGEKVTMRNAPVLDQPDHFNPALIQLADITGTGATDLLYLGNNACQAYLNLSGNAFSKVQVITDAFTAEQPNKIAVTDLLGNGTSCIVWSSALPGNAHAPLRYIDLMNGKKPHLLTRYSNNLGKETHLTYKNSTWFYLKDKMAGRPWITKLPFPVHCVRKSETIDRVTNTRFAQEYSYHHGYYDHAEREFRGFGRVDQLDTERYAQWVKGDSDNITEEDLYQPPVLTKTWFHTGAFLDKDRILTQYQQEYWYNELVRQGFAAATGETALPDARLVAAAGIPATVIDDLLPVEWQQAFRACKGMVLRKEVFALDVPVAGATNEQLLLQLLPFTVSTHNCFIELLQRRNGRQPAVFLIKESEAVTWQYERNTEDPRIHHTLNIVYDEKGNVLESADITYARIMADTALPAAIQAKQQRTLVTYTQNTFTNDVLMPAAYCLRQLSESMTYELQQAVKAGKLFTVEELDGILDTATEQPYHFTASPPAGVIGKRLIEHTRTVYYNSLLTAALPLHSLQAPVLTYESYRKAYTPALLMDIYGTKVNNALLTEGRFVHSEGDADWWIKSGTTQYLHAGESSTDAQNRFYAPVSYTEPFGGVTKVKYLSDYYLLMHETEDSLQNRMQVQQFNFRTLSPQRTIDANDNITEVLLDELGLVKAMAVMGKGNEADELTGLQEVTTLAADQQISNFLATGNYPLLHSTAAGLLQKATTRFVYDLHRYKNSGGLLPAVVATIVREQHAVVNVPVVVSLSFEYTNGAGSVIMKKVQADTDRWIGNGRTILNNKGKAVKQYEPYFSATHEYEQEKTLVETGVTPVLYYDALGRLIKTMQPNGTFSKTTFDAWRQLAYDANDTVLESTWYHNRINRLIDAALLAAGKDPVKEKEAAAQTALHAHTPAAQHFDAAGRPVLSVTHNGKDGAGDDIFFTNSSETDIEGNVLQIIDARNNSVMQYRYDMLGNQVYQQSMDAGKRWLLQNIMGNPLRTWDERGQEWVFEYDILHRPVSKTVKGHDGAVLLNHMVEKVIYGESVANAQLLNLRTRAAILYDTAGKLESVAFDYKGNMLQSKRRFTLQYKEVVNWNVPDADSALEAESFTVITSYDALNRIVQQTAPDGSITRPVYNQGGWAQQLAVTQNGAEELFVKHISYNEKGQRNSILYGNDSTTVYTYDKETFALHTLQTTKPDNSLLQHLHYTFDPCGNITHQEDKNIPEVFFGNEHIKGVAQYTYDALYRLVKATGREHSGQLSFQQADNWNDLPFIKQYSATDVMAWRNYTQQYSYDAGGNIIQLQHQAFNGNWTRNYQYAANSNRLLATTIGADSFNYTYHPQHGFITALPHLSLMQWNCKDELQAVAQQSVQNGSPETTWYVYDGNGMRVRKITERQAATGITPGKKSEWLYLGNTDVYKAYDNTGNVMLKRYTCHVMDDKQRIALIETRVEGMDDAPQKLVRYQFSNHLGSVGIETDSNGRVISYEEFHPFGTTAYQATDKDIKAAYKRYRYTGMERDEESGMQYHASRYYLPWLARWLSADPAGLKGGLNLYAYVNNNPVMLHDPSGNDGETCGVYDEEAQMCYSEACPTSTSAADTPPPPSTPPRVRVRPRRTPPPAPPPDPVPVNDGPTISAETDAQRIERESTAILNLDMPPGETDLYPEALIPYAFLYGIKHSIYTPIREWVSPTPRLYINSEGNVAEYTGPRDHTDAIPAIANLALLAAPVVGELGAVLRTEAVVAESTNAPRLLMVGAESPAEFSWLTAQEATYETTAVNIARSPAATAYEANGGRFIEGGVETLNETFAWTHESFPQPLGRTLDAFNASQARLSTLQPGGRLTILSENQELLELYEGFAATPQSPFTATRSLFTPSHPAAATLPPGTSRFVTPGENVWLLEILRGL